MKNLAERISGSTGCLRALCAAAALLTLAAPGHAAFIARSAFAPGATTYDFSGLVNGTAVVVAGDLTVSGGEFRNDLFDPSGPMDIQNYTNVGAFNPPAGQTIRLDFAAPVSAVGVDVHYNNNPVLFQLFGAGDVLLDSFFGSPTDFSPITGYIGLDAGAAIVTYALMDVPAVPGHNLYIDNVIYQSAVPEPGALALLALGLAGLAVRRRKAGALQVTP